MSSAAEPLLVSDQPDRSEARPLAGTSYAHGATIYVFTQSGSDVRRVRFYLDDPGMHGAARRTEAISPYDFNGTADDDSAVGFDVSTLPAGSHTITAAQETVDGSTRVLSGTFTVATSPTGQGEMLAVSSQPNRSGARPLAGTSYAHGATIYVFTQSGSDVRRVRFYLDDPGMHGAARRTEAISPYDFNGTADDDSAIGFDVSTLPAGSHTITAAQETVDGSTRVLSGTFTVATSPTGQGEMLAVSSQPNRSQAQPLARSTHAESSTIYVFTTPSTDVRRVRFYLDDPGMHGAARRTEAISPYDFNGTADDDSAIGFDVSTLPAGSHTITAAQDTADGQTRVLSATFEVRASERTLLFEDNFDGTSVNTSEWDQYYSPGHDGNGLRRPSAITVGGGNLVLTAQMISGQLVSGGMALRRNHTYGRIEFRARADVDPTGTMNGNVLTWPQSNNWPTDGEMNIWETGWNAGTRRPFYTFVHYSPFNRQHYYIHDADAAQWHTMALEWTASSLKVFRDGALVWTLTDAAAIPDVPHHICIQLDAMARRSLPTPVRMYVDYVRIYR